jgi:hypothetical protein
MRSLPTGALLSFWLVALSVAGPAASPVAAQGRWNDERTLELVRSAIARRSVQLADTGLADYTARAHGYVTFLAQVGDGFPLPPTVIKSDELMVEVYWGAPDRSKQRIIGRRDTLLLPTDIAYHRDHLGVVQNNFPAIIRLGDGDEVRDVPHPLSAAGLATYDYRIDDSLAIRTSDRAIDVMMVSVRPKDDAVAAAVGAVYIDRITASVVRMTFSFTRAALRDRQLEDVSVILENGLVEGRFWLPRRQEIEIRRSVTWMDFPARGIIRGRWEICCVQANVELSPMVFTGPEIAEVPRREQRAFPFEGTVLGGLPDDIRALDDSDVRRVQEEARELVRAGALARARRGAPFARGVSDLVRVNRAEGLALGLGVSQSLGAGFQLRAAGRYGLGDHRSKADVGLSWLSASGVSLGANLYDGFAQAGDAPEVSGLRNSIAAQEFGSDWTDPYGVLGVGARVEWPFGQGMRFGISARVEEQRPLALHGAPATGAYEPLLAAEIAEFGIVGLDWRRQSLALPHAARWDARLQLQGALTGGFSTSSVPAFGRLALDLEARIPLGAWAIASRSIAAVSEGAAAPSQSQVFFGGPVTGPGYDFHSLQGDIGISQRIELQRRVPFASLNLGRFGRAPSTLIVAPYVHQVVIRDRVTGDWQGYPSAGLGLVGLFDLFRLDVARGLRDGRWLLSLDVARSFWGVM